MKHIKLFEYFNLSPIQRKQIENAANSILQESPELITREKPFKREITEEEREKLFKYFYNFSFSTAVDNQNRILFTGGDYRRGEEPKGKYYIYVDDLEKLPL